MTTKTTFTSAFTRNRKAPLLALAILLSIFNSAQALDTAAHTAAMGHLLAGLYAIYPPENSTPQNERVDASRGEWVVIIWGLNDGDECTTDDFGESCRAHRLHFVVSDGLLGGRQFSFRAGPAFFVRVVSFRQIPAEENGGSSCVLFTLEERVKVNPKAPRWEEKITYICATPRGFVKYRPPGGKKP